MRVVRLEEISAAAFAAFGDVFTAPLPGSPRVELENELVNLRPNARARLSLATIAPVRLPLHVQHMERHAFSSQTFVPLQASAYLVLVAANGIDDEPDISTLRAFRVPGHLGINYRAGTWHHPMLAMDAAASFAVWMFVDGTRNDEQFVPLAQPLTIDAAAGHPNP